MAFVLDFRAKDFDFAIDLSAAINFKIPDALLFFIL